MLDISNSLLLMTALFNAGLSVFIFRGNWKKPINLNLGIYLLSLSFWALILIGTQIGSSYELWLYCAKGAYIAGLVIAASFYLFTIAFPEDLKPDTKTTVLVYGSAVIYSLILLFKPTFLTQKIITYSWGHGAQLELYSYVIYTALFCFLYIGGLIRIWSKYFRSEGIVKKRLQIIGWGVSITGISGLYFDIILDSPFFNDFRFIWTGPLFNTVMAVLIMYAVFRLGLFNTKVLVAELTISLLWIFTFLRTLLASDQQEQILNAGLFGLSLIIGFLLIRSIHKEVRARELIEKQEKELEESNKRQENLIHFISHEIKGYLAKSQAGFAAIVEGDYGQPNPEMKNMASMALAETRKGVDTVMDILSAGNMKKGTVTYAMEPFDFRQEVVRVIEQFKSAAREKNLTITLTIGNGNYTVLGDVMQLGKHVIANLVDNAIKYTLEGKIVVALSRSGNKILFSLQDSGVGITDEDKGRLFTEGGRGKDSLKVNAHSTGYGLFIAKSIVEAHHGRIWAQSEGAGKGTTFFVELPAKQ